MKKQLMKPTNITPSQLNSRQNQLLIVDVRSALEYWMGHIPGAKLMGRNRILKEIPKGQAIAVTCASGHRSMAASQWLIEQGYSKVYNLQGGLMAWQRAGYPVQRGGG